MHYAALIIAFGLAPLASAHCKITGAQGDQGGSAAALGIRMGSGNSEADVTIFQGSGAFGETEAGGNVTPNAGIRRALRVAGSSQLPQVSSGGSLNMVLHQVNGDGAGPMSCSISTDASGSNWQQLAVTQNVPGDNGQSGANNQDFPLNAAMPQGLSCTGTVGAQTAVCLVKCENPVGPFGGVVPIQVAGGGAAAAAAAGGQDAKAQTPAGQQAQADQQGQKGQKKHHKDQQDQDQAQAKRADDNVNSGSSTNSTAGIDCEMQHQTASGWKPKSEKSENESGKRSVISVSTGVPAVQVAAGGKPVAVRAFLRREESS